MQNILYIASKSKSRKKLLQEARIPFEVLEQDADENQCDWSLPLQDLVTSIAHCKMEHVIMPTGTQGQIAFVVTADTLSIDPTGKIRGKPIDQQEAIEMLQAAGLGVNICGTAFCLEKKVFANNSWTTQEKIVGYAQAFYEFQIPDSWISDYLKTTNALEAAGAIKIEDGKQFVKSINGSYSAIIGLPMFELREALIQIGF